MSDGFCAYEKKLKYMDDHLKRTGWKFIAGNQMSIADFVLFSQTWDFWLWKKPEIVAKQHYVMKWFKECMMAPGCKEIMGPGSMMMTQVLPNLWKTCNGDRFKVPNTLDDHVKLHYFALYGRSSAIAAMLHMGGADWEYCGFGFDTWPNLKPTMVGGSVPNLEFADGCKIGESLDIARLIAGKFNFFPDDPKKFGECNELVTFFAGMLGDFTSFGLPSTPEADKPALMQKAINDATPKLIKKVCETLAANKTQFLCGDRPTMADFFAGKFYVDMLANPNCPIYEPTQATVKGTTEFSEWGERYKSYL